MVYDPAMLLLPSGGADGRSREHGLLLQPTPLPPARAAVTAYPPAH